MEEDKNSLEEQREEREKPKEETKPTEEPKPTEQEKKEEPKEIKPKEIKPKESVEDKSEKLKTSASIKKEKPKKKEEPSKIKIGILVILGILTIISGISYYKLVVKYKNIPPRVIYQEEKVERKIVKENVTLHVPSETNEALVEKQMEIVVGDTEEERIKNILLALKEEMNYTLKYTDQDGSIVEIPFLKDEVQVLDVYFDGTDVYLNMNYHFKDNMKVISQEIFIIYSIVNTLTEDSRYKRVKFLINDKEVEQLNFYKLSDFYERNLEI